MWIVDPIGSATLLTSLSIFIFDATSILVGKLAKEDLKENDSSKSDLEASAEDKKSKATAKDEDSSDNSSNHTDEPKQI